MTLFTHSNKIIFLALAGLFIFHHNAIAETLDTIVAVVNDDVIMASELEQKLDRVHKEYAQKGAQLPPEADLKKRVLDQLIMADIQLQMAKRLGIKVDDSMLNRAISNIAAENGISLDKFRETLENEGYDFNQFREDIRNEITLTRLRQRQIDDRIFVSDREIKNYLATQSQQGNDVEEFRIQHILIAIPKDADKKQQKEIKSKAEKILEKLRSGADFTTVTAEVSDASDAKNGGDMGWQEASRVPSLFTSLLPDLKKGQISDIIKSDNGYHIIKLIGKRSSDIQMIPQIHARHILIHTNDLISDEEAKARLQQLKERIEAGADFSKLARSHSDDKASAVKGGDLGWISPGTMVPEFEKQMEKLSDGEISEPFKTQFGWHIVQVLGHRQHDSTEELTRSKARAAIKKRKIQEERQSWLLRLRDEAYVEYRL